MLSDQLERKKFGLLTVIKKHSKDNHGHWKWLCKCDCGKKTIALGDNIKRLHTISCGCENIKAKTKHGMYHTREYNTYRSMLQRCYNKNNIAYKHYGGRGITICKKWRKSFIAFYNDMGKRPKGKNLDRINNDKGYYKKNCRWVTPSENNYNKKRA